MPRLPRSCPLTLAPWAVLALLLASPLSAQRELPCKTTVIEPRLDFEFRFFTGYRVSIPAREMLGPRRPIALQATVTPLDREGAEPVRMQRAEQAGPIPEHLRRQTIEVSGSFVVGEGRYRVLWQMYDSLGAYCELSWEIEAKRARGERDLRLAIEPGEVGESRLYLFRRQRIRPEPGAGEPLDLRVFLNLDPWRSRRTRASIRLLEFVPRLAALRALAKHPRVGRISLVAYSVDEQTVYFRRGLRNELDLSAIEAAIEKLSPAFVSIDQLGRDKPRNFFLETMNAEFPGDEPADAFVFLGPDAEIGRKLPTETKRSLERPPAPAFMLQTPQTPWRGMIGDFVKALGGRQYRFSSPQDLALAVDDLIGRIPGKAP